MDKISTGICIVSEYDDTIFFKAQCSCTDAEDEQRLCMSYNRDLQQVELLISSNLSTEYAPNSYTSGMWETISDWTKSLVFNCKQVYRLLTTGILTVEASFLFESEAQIQDYITALQQGLEKLKKKITNYPTWSI